MVLGEIVGLIFSCVKIANENERENQRQCVRYVQVPQQQVVMVSHHHPRQMCAQKPRTINRLIQGQISFRDSRCVYRAYHAQQHISQVRSRLSRVVEAFISNNNTHRDILVVSNPRDPVKLNQEPLEGFIVESHGNAVAKMATHTL